MDGGRGGVGAEVRVARRPADGRYAVDAVLRGLLRGRRVRRTVGRGGVQPTGRQSDAVHHVAEGGRGPRTAATAHADHDGRVQTSHPGSVHTEEHDNRSVEGERIVLFRFAVSKLFLSLFLEVRNCIETICVILLFVRQIGVNHSS